MKIEVVNLFVLLVFILGFIFLVSLDKPPIVGFTVKDFGDLEIDKEIDVIITLKDDSSYSEKDNIKSQQDKFVKLNDLELNNDYDNINAIAVSLDSDSLEKIKSDPNVESITFDQIFTVSLSSSKFVIDADRVWDKLYNGENLTGAGSVCVLDTGVDYNQANLNGRVVNGYDFVNDDNDAMDDNGHGTHVAGIITSDDSVNRGVAFGGNVIAVKVMGSDGKGLGGDIIDGIDWCINHKDEYNISVISMSIGSDALFSDVCDDAYQEFTNIINAAVGSGILVVSSSSNDHNSGSLSLPACISNSTSVGAVDDGDNVASFSNSASFLDILAPGVSITSTKNGGGFVSMSGTSMAAPHVGGAVLVVKQYSDLVVFDLKDVLVENGDDVLDSRNGLTFPRLNLFKVLISLDSFEPVLSFDISDVYDDKNQTLVASAVDTFLDTILVEVDGVNYSNGYVLDGFNVGENISFKFYANDSAGNSVSDGSSFIVLDGTPILEDIGKLVGVVDKEFSYDVTASDPTDDVLSYDDDSDLFDIVDGLISFTPSETGNYTININVSDGYHLVSDVFDFEIVLNNTAPEIVSYVPLDLNPSLNENLSLELSVVASDVDGGNLDYYWYLDSEIVSEISNYIFVSDYSSSGKYNVTVVVSDGIESVSLEWNVVVNDVDLVPVYLGGIGDISFDENTNYSLNLTNNFVDLDGDSLYYNMSNDGNLSFVDNILIPASNFDGVLEIVFYGCDLDNDCAESELIDVRLNNVVVCWDGLLEGSEQCDMNNFNGKTCLDFDYNSGSLSCDADCRFDYTGCVINPPSGGGGTPSGGGGTRIETGGEENVEEKTEEVKTEIKTASVENNPLEGAGEVVKEEIKPKTSKVRAVFIKIKDFFKGVWYKIARFIKTKL